MPAETRLFVWDDEHGNFFCEGHIDPSASRDACVRYAGEELQDEWRVEEAEAMRIDAVKHEWWRLKFPGTEDDETMVWCDPSEDGATPFTAWRL